MIEAHLFNHILTSIKLILGSYLHRIPQQQFYCTNFVLFQLYTECIFFLDLPWGQICTHTLSLASHESFLPIKMDRIGRGHHNTLIGVLQLVLIHGKKQTDVKKDNMR